MRASRHPNVSRIGRLFDDLGFQPLLVEQKIRDASNHEVGDIDLAFSYEELVLLIEVSKQHTDRNEKIRASFEKWSEARNLDRIRRIIGLPGNLGFFRLYVDTTRSTTTDGISEILTQFRNPQNGNFLILGDDVQYFEDMKSKTGHFAKYDLLSLIGAKPKEGEAPISAIRYHVDGNEAFSFVIGAERLLESAYVSRRRSNDLGYQRALDYGRVREIEEKIRGHQIIAFPNSILINILRRAESNPPAIPNEEPTPCTVQLPREYCSSRIVDGQHRLLAIARLPDVVIRTIKLPVLAFNQLGQDDEIRTFVEINNNQSRVDRNLVLDLLAGFSWDEDTTQYAQKEAVLVARQLSENRVVKIYFGGVTEEREGRIFLATFVKALVGNNLAGWSESIWGTDAYRMSREIFEKIKSDNRITAQWRNYLLSNKGVRVFFRAIYIFERNRAAGRVNISNTDLVSRLAGVADSSLYSEVERLYGEGGVTFGVRAIYGRLKREYRPTFRRLTLDLRRLRGEERRD
jgi:DGQHR domain-containing protein